MRLYLARGGRLLALVQGLIGGRLLQGDQPFYVMVHLVTLHATVRLGSGRGSAEAGKGLPWHDVLGDDYPQYQRTKWYVDQVEEGDLRHRPGHRRLVFRHQGSVQNRQAVLYKGMQSGPRPPVGSPS